MTQATKTAPADRPVFGRRDPDARGYFGAYGGRFVPGDGTNSQRTIPVVCIPDPISETEKPAVRAKLPPLVMGNTTGVRVKRLNAVGETTSTGRVPCCS